MAAFTIASAASTEATSPFVSIIPNACIDSIFMPPFHQIRLLFCVCHFLRTGGAVSHVQYALGSWAIFWTVCANAWQAAWQAAWLPVSNPPAKLVSVGGP